MTLTNNNWLPSSQPTPLYERRTPPCAMSPQPRPQPFLTQTPPPTVRTTHSTSKALHNLSPRTTSFHPAATHNGMGGSRGRSGHPSPAQAWTLRFGRWTISRRPHSSIPFSIKRLRRTFRCQNFRCTMDYRTPSIIRCTIDKL